MPSRDSQPLPERAAATPIFDRANVKRPKTANFDQTTPPFWTWFIENPRERNRVVI
jgi:hypothetical protein